MATEQPGPDSPPPPAQIDGHASANGTNTFAASPCSNPATQCVVCWLRDKIAKDPETHFSSFHTADLELNIVGVRRKDSISDAFDDVQVLFFRPGTPNKKAAFDERLEQAFRDDWQDVFGKAKDWTKVVPCSREGGIWVVAKFPITTDPGLTDYPEEACARRKSASAEALKGNQKALKDNEKAAKDARDTVAQKRETVDAETQALAEKRANGIATGKKLATGEAKRAEEKALTTAKGELAKATGVSVKADAAVTRANAAVESAKTLDAQNQQKLDAALEKAAERDAIGVIGDGKDGGLEVGRGMLECGNSGEIFWYGIHHGSSTEKFRTAHVAIVVGGVAAVRFYAVSLIKSERWTALAHGTAAIGSGKAIPPEHRLRTKTIAGSATPSTRFVVREHFPTGKTSNGQKFLGETATLVEVEKGDGTRDVSIAVDGGEVVALHDNDVITIVAEDAAAMNLHRAHNASLGPGDKLVGAGKSAHVSTWSEGCQTNPSFDAYNLFLRLCQLAKRWRCSKARNNPKDPGCAVLAAGSGAEVGSGEKALLESRGERFINLAALVDIRKDMNVLKHDIDEMRNRREHHWTDARQVELDGLNALASLTVEQKAKKKTLEADRHKNHTWNDAKDPAALDAADARYAVLNSSVTSLADRSAMLARKETLQAEVAKQEKALEKAETEEAAAAATAEQHQKKAATATATALKNAEEKLAKTAETRRDHAARAKTAAARAKQTAEDEIKELDKRKLGDDALQVRNDFLRERTKFFGADFLRECDLHRKCPAIFDYTLIEFDDAGIDELDSRWRKGKPWNGDLVFPGS